MSMMDKAISVIIIDDHPLFRQGVADVLSIESDMLIVAEASDGDEGLKMIRGIRPMVAIVDVNLPKLNGQQLTRNVVAEKISTRILLLTAYDDIDQKIHAIHTGAAGYCTKDVIPENLIKFVRTIAYGGYVIGNRVYNQEGVEEWLQSQTGRLGLKFSDPSKPYLPLSAREMEVLKLVTRGMSNKEVAQSLGISHQTVKNHVTSILRKLSVEDRTQAALYALKRGWVRLYVQKFNSAE